MEVHRKNATFFWTSNVLVVNRRITTDWYKISRRTLIGILEHAVFGRFNEQIAFKHETGRDVDKTLSNSIEKKA